MANFVPIPTYITYGQITQYLSTTGIARGLALKGETLNPNYSRLVYLVRKSLQWGYNQNPSNPVLQQVALYLYQLSLPYYQQIQQIINNQSVGLPTLTGPTNQSVLVGANATFSVTPSGTGPFTYQWKLAGIPILGATSSSYIVSNAQLSQSGNMFSVSVTNPAGTVTSNIATLTVTAGITGFLYYNAADPGPTLQANSDPFVYPTNYPITHNAPISVTMPGASSPNLFLVFKIPSTESAKTIWFNTALNNGNFPDSVFQTPVTFGGFTYYFSRVAATMDVTSPFVMS